LNLRSEDKNGNKLAFFWRLDLFIYQFRPAYLPKKSNNL